ncbi:hypothetical protein L873DRAFT_1817282 [Choiromyces venosus 120613-1]|uniref:Uncharacterized protein n=1 Tax=Choiromyces venosus 120613-1 TaxID=1336337 RepID=A0A3N4J859_9PEZI|nr:hypothetical protein L873DRAFT_1817282 [Choiromyces venosus 120613-1]
MCLGVSQGFRRGVTTPRQPGKPAEEIQGVGEIFGGLRVPPARCLPGRPGLPMPSKSQDL